MAKFISGALLSALLILGWQRFTSEDEVTTPKDTISVRLADQIIEIPDTTRKDSVK